MPKQIIMIDTLETQREYVKSVQRGYGFTRHGNRAHYLFRADQVEPGILARLEPAPHYIFTLVGCTMESATKYGVEPIITPLQSASDWTSCCPEV